MSVFYFVFAPMLAVEFLGARTYNKIAFLPRRSRGLCESVIGLLVSGAYHPGFHEAVASCDGIKCGILFSLLVQSSGPSNVPVSLLFLRERLGKPGYVLLPSFDFLI